MHRTPGESLLGSPGLSSHNTAHGTRLLGIAILLARVAEWWHAMLTATLCSPTLADQYARPCDLGCRIPRPMSLRPFTICTPPLRHLSPPPQIRGDPAITASCRRVRPTDRSMPPVAR